MLFRSRGIVAVPIWLPGFLMFSDWREFFIELEQQLRRHNFVANLIFFRQGEDESPDFAQRVLGHEPESMVRLAPIPTMAFQMICEAGVRPVVLGNMPGQLLPGQRYFLSWNRGLQQCLAAWKKAGIRTVTIPRADPAPFTSATHAGERLIREAGLDCRIARPGGADWANYLDKLGRFDGEAVMFDEDIWQSRLCAQAPRAVAGLIRRVPVMVLRHLNVAAPDLAGAHVDWLGHDMRAIARRVAHDLDTGAAFSPGTPTVFEAEWNPHVPAEGRAAPFGFD